MKVTQSNTFVCQCLLSDYELRIVNEKLINNTRRIEIEDAA